MCETHNPRKSRIWLLVQDGCLDRFDAAIKGYYLTRSEAIRHGMGLVLREVASMRRIKGEPLEAPVGPVREEAACLEGAP
ncbi:MAG: hypothetical protein ABIJ47_11595 [Candidatus Bathyarchaeota archaeon]